MNEQRTLVTGGSGFIGTNLMSSLHAGGSEVINLDWNPPLDPRQRPWWRSCNIMDEAEMARVFEEFKPTRVVHLAARTDTNENDLEAYVQNHEGTRRLFRVIKGCSSVDRIIVTSTQFVCEAGYQPKHDLDFKPFTQYGESKRLTELVVREAGLACTWTIIRPTTIWGPYSLRYRDVMFKVMRKGLYFHPGGRRVVRSYGYVENVVWQIERMLGAPKETVHGRVYYVGDQPFDLRIWVDALSRRLTGRSVRYVPTAIVHLLALVGDALKAVHLPFPITSGRFRSMTSDYITPMDRTIEAFGLPPFTLEEAVDRTVRWYEDGSERYQTPHRIDVRKKHGAMNAK